MTMVGMGKVWAMAAAAGLASAYAMAQSSQMQSDPEFHARQADYLTGLQAKDGWAWTESGLRYRRVKAGPGGPSPSPTDTVTLHYVGTFVDGIEFDSSVARGRPATFPLPGLIRGWQEGVPLMRVGDTFEFAIPYDLAYGPQGRGPIPGGATLLFTVELLGIEVAE